MKSWLFEVPVWTRADLRLALLAQAWSNGNDVINGFNTSDVITGGAGNDTINAGDGDDLITGGTGNDTITGLSGNDDYIYSRGDGWDSITEAAGGGSDDRLALHDIDVLDIIYSANGNDIILSIESDAPGSAQEGGILLKSNLVQSNYSGIENIVFDSGEIVSLRSASTWLKSGGAANDIIIGTSGRDFIYGNGGADTIDGAEGDDYLVGGAGADSISGGSGIDTISYANSVVGVSVNLEIGQAAEMVSARFVRIYQTNGKYLNIAEVEVSVDGVNIAPAGVASQTSVGWGGVASRANDGNRDGVFDHNSVSHVATTTPGEWWQVDLGSAVDIDRIEIFNRIEYVANLSNFDVVLFSTAPATDETTANIMSRAETVTIRYSGTVPGSAVIVGGVDSLSLVESVIGSIRRDVLVGDADANRLDGAAGNDELDGGDGDDVLVGGSGRDMFRFTGQFGRDVIADFSTQADAFDIIVLEQDAFETVDDILAASVQMGDDVLIEGNGDTSILLKGIALSDLNSAHFQLV